MAKQHKSVRARLTWTSPIQSDGINYMSSVLGIMAKTQELYSLGVMGRLAEEFVEPNGRLHNANCIFILALVFLSCAPC